ncbi:MAG: 16S rRNA (guanine(527)-N(7))-methyltransferase RsmG [Acidobacteria bacterium]|nr:16S rRNA (guanine(527)-N(7))-methyltransferase RsmG [Acidobacteriota bacterium]
MESAGEYYKIFQRLSLPFDPQAAEKIDVYINLLKKWNSRINLTASSEWSVLEPLLLEGIWASRIYPEDAKNHLDLGSGAGFPAIPLKIMVPRMKLDMVDSRLKRVSFLETVTSELKLSESSAFHGRITDYLDTNDKEWDCVSWKGLKIKTKDINKLIKHTHGKTQFWIFHGRQLAAEEPERVEKSLRLLRREKFPYKSEWRLSVYLPE